MKKIRKPFISKPFDAKCKADDLIEGHIDNLAEELKLSPSSIPQDNISDELFQTGG